jgi:Leucine-rich repeat (LRR) protein
MIEITYNKTFDDDIKQLRNDEKIKLILTIKKRSHILDAINKISFFDKIKICLILNNLNLKNIPECIFNLPNILSLELDYNQLTFIPSSISKLVNLKGLSLRCNNFHEFPICITELKNLIFLYLTKNKISDIPNINNLKNLTKLEISCNKFKIFPNVYNLKNLIHLGINFNRFKILPFKITNLTSLESIDIDRTKNIDILRDLKNLEVINDTDYEFISKGTQYSSGCFSFLNKQSIYRLYFLICKNKKFNYKILLNIINLLKIKLFKIIR